MDAQTEEEPRHMDAQTEENPRHMDARTEEELRNTNARGTLSRDATLYKCSACGTIPKLNECHLGNCRCMGPPVDDRTGFRYAKCATCGMKWRADYAGKYRTVDQDIGDGLKVMHGRSAS